MQVTLLDKDCIEAEWPDIAEVLAPALKHDPEGMTAAELFVRLMKGRAQLVAGQGEGVRGFLAFQLFEADGELCCFASYLAGSVSGGPRQMVRTMRELMSDFEIACRDAGVKQMFIGGRDWGRVFPEYELTGDVPNRRKKRL